MFSVVAGFVERLRPCWSRLGSDWVFLLFLGIVMALISFVLDLAIDKCQTGVLKYFLYNYILSTFVLTGGFKKRLRV